MAKLRIPLYLSAATIAIAVIFGVGAGIGSYAFIYGRGYVYLTDDPRACVQCHVMQEQYDGWSTSTHRAAAKCNSCHAPSDFIGKYVTKAVNGFNHSLAFTTGRFAEPIRIKPWNLRIAQKNCVSCHQGLWESARTPHPPVGKTVSCTQCHQQVGHPH